MAGSVHGHVGREYGVKLVTIATTGRKQTSPSYFITSHQSQVSQGFAALRNQGGSLICDFFTPSNIHRLYGHAVSPNGDQCCREEQRKPLH